MSKHGFFERWAWAIRWAWQLRTLGGHSLLLLDLEARNE